MATLKDSVADWVKQPNQLGGSSVLEGSVTDFTQAGFFNLERGENFFSSGAADLLGAGGVRFLGGLLGLGTGVQQQEVQRSYAQDSIDYAPKNKFLFKVYFEFDDAYGLDFINNNEFMYMVKSTDRPTVEYDYEEVNMYNFRTKVLKTMRFNTINMTFYDDIKNKVIYFFDAYRKAYSPLSSVGQTGAMNYEQNGLAIGTPNFSAATSILDGGAKNMLKSIKIYQIFGHGSYVNVFTFINPKIESLELDGLDMEVSDVGMMNISFGYDNLYLQMGRTQSDDDGNLKLPYAWGQRDLFGTAQSNESADRKTFPGTTDSDPKLNVPPQSAASGPQPSVADRIKSAILGQASSFLGGKANSLINEKLADSGLKGGTLSAAQGVFGTAGGNIIRGGTTASGNFLFGKKS